MKFVKLFFIGGIYCFVVIVICMILLDKSKTFNILPKFIKVDLNSSERCGRFPTEEHVVIDNLYWQILELPKGFLNILNAYLDLRQNKSVVRINVNSVLLNESNVFYCQFWYDEVSPPAVVKASEVLLMWSE